MHPLLTSLGIRPEVQDFFAPFHDDLIFPYGNDYEYFTYDGHRIPVTVYTWIAGDPDTATDLFICGSAMDAIAYNRVAERYAFIAVGAVPSKTQLETLPNLRFHLLFDNDALGAVCDIKAASFIRKQPVQISFHQGRFQVEFRKKTYRFDRLTLSALEKASGYRFGIRTHKPKNANSWISSLGLRPYSPS